MSYWIFLGMAPIAIVTLSVTLLALRPYRAEGPARALMWYFALAALLVAGNLLELASADDAPTVFWARAQYLPLLFLPVPWLSFCMRYTGWSRLVGRTAIQVTVAVAAALSILALTDPLHHLVWLSVEVRRLGWLSTVRPAYGPVFWVMAAWNWSMIGSGALIVLRSYVRAESPVYRQSLLIVIGALLPGIANLVYLLRLAPGVNKDFTPIGFALAGIFFAFGLYFQRLVWIMPVARGVLLQSLDTGIVALDRHGRVVDHNAAADAMFALPRVVVGQRADSFPELAALLPRLASSSAARITIGGRELLAKNRPMPGSAPGDGMVLTVEDVTELVRAREELESARLQLAHAEKLAAIGSLVAGVAHEINNPLAYVQSDLRSLETMLASPDSGGAPEETAAVIASLKEGSERIASTVRSLLALARKERRDEAPAPWDPDDGMLRTLDLCRVDFGDSVRVDLSLGNASPVEARGREIEQVLLNLLSNANSALRDRGGGTIAVRIAREGDVCVIEVENDGPAIPRDASERIFDPFFTTKSEGAGTGLGLFVSRDIVERRHGGKLFLASNDPVRFRLELPYASSAGR